MFAVLDYIHGRNSESSGTVFPYSERSSSSSPSFGRRTDVSKRTNNVESNQPLFFSLERRVVVSAYTRWSGSRRRQATGGLISTCTTADRRAQR